MTTSIDRPGGLLGIGGGCVLDVGHRGNCKDGQGRTWTNNHPDCPDCCRHQTMVARAVYERDVARAELARLRAAIDLVHGAAPAEVEQLRLAVEG